MSIRSVPGERVSHAEWQRIFGKPQKPSANHPKPKANGHATMRKQAKRG